MAALGLDMSEVISGNLASLGLYFKVFFMKLCKVRLSIEILIICLNEYDFDLITGDLGPIRYI